MTLDGIMRPDLLSSERFEPRFLHGFAGRETRRIREVKATSKSQLKTMPRKGVKRVLSALVNIQGQPTPRGGPGARTSALVPMYLEWIVIGIPVTKLLFAHEAYYIVPVFEAGIIVEASIGESLWSRPVRGRVRPFE